MTCEFNRNFAQAHQRFFKAQISIESEYIVTKMKNGGENIQCKTSATVFTKVVVNL